MFGTTTTYPQLTKEQNVTEQKTQTVEQIDPATLVIEANVRFVPEFVKEDQAFLNSIRDHGVLVPVVAVRDADGAIRVRTGQRRTLAARAAALPSIPVYIVEGTESERERIVQQLAENDHRKGLSDAEHVAAFKALELDGMSMTAITKKTHHRKEHVRAALAVGKSEKATAAVATASISLEHAAAMIEFEDDEEATAELTEAAVNDPADFPHALKRVQKERERSILRTGFAAAHEADGYTVLDARPAFESRDYVGVGYVRTADGERIEQEGVEQVEGRAVFISQTYWDDAPTASYFIPTAALSESGLSDNRSTYNGKPIIAAPQTDEEAQAEKDEATAERRRVIANNRALDAANEVRREWITTLLNRKTLPKDAALYIARRLASSVRASAYENKTAATLYGVVDGQALSEQIDLNPTRATHVALAIVIGNVEDGIDKTTWRNPNGTVRGYLTQIAAWGYTLSEVEQGIVDEFDEAKARWEATADEQEDGDLQEDGDESGAFEYAAAVAEQEASEDDFEGDVTAEEEAAYNDALADA